MAPTMAMLRNTLFLLTALILLGAVVNSCARSNPRPAEPQMPATPLIQQPAFPMPATSPVIHVLRASYYAPKFNGKRTTSGERYNPNALTAASKTLPLGTVVKVVNPKNGRSVKVRINDRGPFVRGRGLDLSHRAAQKIGITHDGVARVKVVEQKPSRTPRVATPDIREASAD